MQFYVFEAFALPLLNRTATEVHAAYMFTQHIPTVHHTPATGVHVQQGTRVRIYTPINIHGHMPWLSKIESCEVSKTSEQASNERSNMSYRSFNLRSGTLSRPTTRLRDIFPSRRGSVRFYIAPMLHFSVLQRHIHHYTSLYGAKLHKNYELHNINIKNTKKIFTPMGWHYLSEQLHEWCKVYRQVDER